MIYFLIGVYGSVILFFTLVSLLLPSSHLRMSVRLPRRSPDRSSPRPHAQSRRPRPPRFRTPPPASEPPISAGLDEPFEQAAQPIPSLWDDHDPHDSTDRDRRTSRHRPAYEVTPFLRWRAAWHTVSGNRPKKGVLLNLRS